VIRTEAATRGHADNPIPARRERLQRPNAALYTGVRMLENMPKECHFVPLFGPPGGVSRRQASLRMSLQYH
jgi:hypothetical protein